MIEAPTFAIIDKLALRMDVNLMHGNLAVTIEFSNKNNNIVTSILNSTTNYNILWLMFSDSCLFSLAVTGGRAVIVTI